jgi:hypothetical protein
MENTQGAVPEKLEHFTAIFFMQVEEDGPVPGPEQKGMVLIDMHEMGVPYDIGKNDGRELAFKLLLHDGLQI